MVMKKAVILAATGILTFSLSACAGPSQSTESKATTESTQKVSTQKQESSSAKADTSSATSSSTDSQKQEPIEVKTDWGSYCVQVNGLVTDASLNENFFGTDLAKTHVTAVLTLKVSNESYVNSYTPDVVTLEPDIHMVNEKGKTINAMSKGPDYGDYKAATAASIEVKQGDSVSTVLYYAIEKDAKEVKVVVGDKELILPVSQN